MPVPGKALPPLRSRMIWSLEWRMSWQHQNIQTLYRKQEVQEADRSLHNPQNRRWRNMHSHTCHTEVNVQYASNQKARQNAFKQQQSRQPVIQFDFAYLETSTDVQQQLCMVLAVPDKSIRHDYMTNCQRSFIFECGRPHGISQCGNEPTLKTVATAAAAAKIGNRTLRQTRTYSSNSQGSVERFHRTLFGQGKSLELVKASYNNNHTINNYHPLTPWMLRHAAWLINRYSVHSDGHTSYQRRWERDYKHAICEFGETVLYKVPAKQLNEGAVALRKAIWLGVDEGNGESFVGTTEGVIMDQGLCTP